MLLELLTTTVQYVIVAAGWLVSFLALYMVWQLHRSIKVSTARSQAREERHRQRREQQNLTEQVQRTLEQTERRNRSRDRVIQLRADE